MVDWTALWIRLFGSVDGWFGIDWGFWVGMIIVAIVVIGENLFFWTRKPYAKTEKGKKELEREKERNEELEDKY